MARRLLLAFVVAPLFTPLVFIFTTFSRNALRPSLTEVAIIFSLYAPFAYLAEVLFGIPAFFLYRFFAWKSLLAYGIGGATIGLIAATAMLKFFNPWSVASGDFVWCLAAGVASALAFRFISRYQPDYERSVAIDGEI